MSDLYLETPLKARFQSEESIHLPSLLYRYLFNNNYSTHSLQSQPAIDRFVPPVELLRATDAEVLANFLDSHRSILILTGAGISTESGIPDYRSEKVGLYSRSTQRPMMFSDFLATPRARQRYWARNFVAWPNFSNRKPNEGHISVRTLQRLGKVHWLVTQNVDSLHRLAGSDCLTELHGCGGRVRCLGCGFVTTRDAFQRVLLARNPSWSSTLKAGANDATRSLGEIRPDGDVVLVPGAEATFEIPSCPRCTDDPSTRDLPALPESVDGEPHGMPFTGTKNPALRGVLITDIVFMGGNVPRAVVERVNAHVDACDALLVLGSSLQTYSAYRIVDRAHQRRLPIAIVNIGPTRADPLQKAPTGEKLPDSLFLRLRCRIGHLLPPAIELLQSFPKVRG